MVTLVQHCCILLSGLSKCCGAGGSGAAGVKLDKVLVFSQWTSMLDLLEIPLKRAKIAFRRLDGTMTVPARERAIGDFETKPEVLVMLVSGAKAEIRRLCNHAVTLAKCFDCEQARRPG